MYEMSDIKSFVDGKNTVASSENVRSVEKSAGQDKKAKEQEEKQPKPEEVKGAVAELNAACSL